ncbi:MAG TPA: Zn-dependent hydrolase [Vicinamibacterales bacterium]|nr:Zn-dependent hydrolase [Vicinamibacterales bacterium]
MSAQNVVANLRELAQLTSTADGAQRLAWGPVWRQAREWFNGKLAEIGITPEIDAAGNSWATLKGASDKTVIIGSHLDSVPNGGWLDGALGVMAGLEALRMFKAQQPPVTLKVVDWADEEGARFGRSLLGSSAAAGSLDISEIEHLADKTGVTLVDALRENGVELSRIHESQKYLRAIDGKAYLELHIEQGPVLESMNKPAGVVQGTFGVERHLLRFVGQAAHSGSTPIPMRKDAFLAAAESAIAFREIARKYTTPTARVVCTVGTVKVEPGIVTAVPGACEISLDQRAIDAKVLASMLADARAAAWAAAANNKVSVEWKRIWRIEPRPFAPALIHLCEEALREVTGDAPHLPSGPLHDAAEMAPFMPTVMMFAYSSNGLSHCKEEDTPEPHLLTTIEAFLRLADKVVRS